jgi:hypothetical protein
LRWEPLHESHSIEVAAAAVNFTEPLTEIAWRKTVRDAEAVCRPAGLSEKSAMNVVQFTIGPVGAAPGVPLQIEAIVFSRSAANDVPGIGLQKVVLESLLVSRAGLNYQTTAYTRWETFQERLRSLMRSPLHGALHVVGTANLRLEYAKTTTSIVRFRSAMITVLVVIDRLRRHCQIESIESAYRLLLV